MLAERIYEARGIFMLRKKKIFTKFISYTRNTPLLIYITMEL